MEMAEYLKDAVIEMQHRSEAIRRDFARHSPSAGDNREDIVERFLKRHLPKRFGISTGFVFSHDGERSKQADLLVVDNQNNTSLYPDDRSQFWPVEAVYALIEVKTQLNRRDLEDAIAKGRRFKSMQRKFLDAGQNIRIKDSLFVVWSFESPEASTVKQNLVELLNEVPRREQPDMIVVPNRIVASVGSYLELSKLGQQNSPYRRQRETEHGDNLSALIKQLLIYELGVNSLMGWYIWFDSWLRQAGPRFADPIKYLPSNEILGRKI